MPFITKEDFDASVHEDILNALTKGNDDVITDNVANTIAEMESYLTGRYDVDNIFNKEGDQRNKFLLRIGLTLSKYYIYLAHNPRKLNSTMVAEFEKAIEDLEKIQAGKLTPKGLPTPQQEEGVNSGNGAPVQWGSQTNLGTSW